MKTMWHKYLSSSVMLAVVLVLTFVTPFHHHGGHSVPESCDACVHHQPHAGHIGMDSSLSECLACQLLSAPYTSSQPRVLRVYLNEIQEFTGETESCPLPLLFSGISSRAPPCSFCL